MMLRIAEETGTITRLDQGEKPGCAGRDEGDRRLILAVVA
jgi:hypothetical protein